MKRESGYLLPYETITYPPTRTRNRRIDDTPYTQAMETTSMEMTSMKSRQLQSSQKEAMKKIMEFSGESNELDVNEWLSNLTNLFSLMKLQDAAKILETMGKLTGPALQWYQENLTSFAKWEDTERSLKDRFKEFSSDSQALQEFITEHQVITVLQTDVKNSLKEHLIRKEKDIKKPEDWLQVAKEEEYVQKRIQQQRHGFYSEPTTQPFFEPLLPTTTIQIKPSRNIYPQKLISVNQQQYQQGYKSSDNTEHTRIKMTILIFQILIE